MAGGGGGDDGASVKGFLCYPRGQTQGEFGYEGFSHSVPV